MVRTERAYLLGEVVGLLPAIAVLVIVSSQLVSRSVRAQRVAHAHHLDEVRMHAIVARLSADARRSESVRIEPGEDGTVLALQDSRGRTMRYEVGQRMLRRTEQSAGQIVHDQTWALSSVETDFQLETLGAGRQVVWLRFTHRVPIDVAATATGGRQNVATRVQLISAAARVGNGGTK